MIDFTWEFLSNESCRINIKTDATRPGTLFKLASAIYALNLNVVSGNILTQTIDNQPYSIDQFILSSSQNSSRHFSINEATALLGELMETILSENFDYLELLKKYETQYPINLFKDNPDAILHTSHAPDHKATKLIIHSNDKKGLLFHITHVLSDLGINVINATILTTNEGQIEDTFYVSQNDQSLTEPMLRDFETRLLEIN